MRKKFAFIVHDPTMLVHYRELWDQLGAEKFAIITTTFFAKSPDDIERLGLEDFNHYVKANRFEVIPIETIISQGIKYEYSISNHVISGNTADKETSASIFERAGYSVKRILSRYGLMKPMKLPLDQKLYLPLQVAKKHIRYMYGADISEGWSLQPWNSIYEIFLCHGINDKAAVESRFKGRVFVMGYPRYDRYFEGAIDLSDIQKEFGIAEGKKTLLWMPTLAGPASTIPYFAEPLSKLAERYNLIVRPHPLSFVQEPEYISILEKYGFRMDRNSVRDMNELFSLVDVVLADYGGTPFSAIFLGKNVVLLDSPDPNLDPLNIGSSVMELRQHLPVFLHTELDKLDKQLASAEFMAENNKVVDILFKKYFDSPRGGGAKRVADFLETL